jgi:GNAT superfamily N-acetyltransferase
MAEYLIRLADPGDAEQIMNLRKRIDKAAGNKNPPLDPYGGGYPTLKQQTSEIDDYIIKGIFLVAVHQEEVIGAAYCFPKWNSPGEYGFKFLVDVQWRGKGIATQFVAEIIQWAKSTTKAKKLLCRFSKSDKTARRILEKSGFSVLKQGLVPYIQGHFFRATEMYLNIRRWPEISQFG